MRNDRDPLAGRLFIRVSMARGGRTTGWVVACDACGPVGKLVTRRDQAIIAARDHFGPHEEAGDHPIVKYEQVPGERQHPPKNMPTIDVQVRMSASAEEGLYGGEETF